LKEVLSEEDLSNAYFVVYLNKMDTVEGYRPKEKILEIMEVERYQNDNRVLFQPCSLKKNMTVEEGIKWLSKNMIAL
jgi:ADP-ribosylation factor family.